MRRASLAAIRRQVAYRQHAHRLQAVAPGAWTAHAGMFRFSTAVVGLASRRAATASIVLLLPSAKRRALFAGVRTALEAAASMASRTGMPLRVLTFDERPSHADAAALSAVLTDELGALAAPIEIDSVWTSAGGSHADDLWIATYWTTAHALHVAAQAGMVSAERVVSLVQDHEPSFFAASTESAAAAATYGAGFRTVVNSAPLQRFLAVHEGLSVPHDHVFRPALDLGRLAVVRAERSSSPIARLGFYARPSKPRNAHRTGIAALRVAAAILHDRGIPFEVTSMGEQHGVEALPGGTTVQVAGRLGWSAYFERLAVTDVLLSLQMTPHPSHPPLDMVASGGVAVTNDLLGSRVGLHPSLLAVPSDPESLGTAVADAAAAAADHEPAASSDDFVRSLGRPLSDVVDTVLEDVLR